MAKSRDAFRTISEVADWLDTPAHVLRFWESKFSQVKPVKRAGGRRYYRPADVALLAGLKQLLHEDGLTIKGAQKVLREKGVKYVSGLVSLPEDADDAPLELDADIEIESEESTVIPFAPPASDAEPALADSPQSALEEPEPTPELAAFGDTAPQTPAPDDVSSDATPDLPPVPERSEEEPEALSPAALAPPPGSLPEDEAPAEDQIEDVTSDPSWDDAADTIEDAEIVPETVAALPGFITGEETATADPAAPVALGADIPPDPLDDDIEVTPGPLARLSGIDRIPPELAARLAPQLDQLRAQISSR